MAANRLKTTANGTTEDDSVKTAVAEKPKKKLEIPATGIVIPRPNRIEARIGITGIAPLIVHAWDEKARKMILDKQMKKAKAPLAAKDPKADYEASMYRFPDGGHGFPAGAFKDAMVQACRFAPDLSMTFAKLLFFVKFDGVSTQGMRCVKINGKPRMREDMVRINKGQTADIRFRAEYSEWSAELRVSFNRDIISLEQMLNLCALAGCHVGVGEMRPSAPESRTGDCGLWEVDGID